MSMVSIVVVDSSDNQQEYEIDGDVPEIVVVGEDFKIFVMDAVSFVSCLPWNVRVWIEGNIPHALCWILTDGYIGQGFCDGLCLDEVDRDNHGDYYALCTAYKTMEWREDGGMLYWDGGRLSKGI